MYFLDKEYTDILNIILEYINGDDSKKKELLENYA